MAPAASRNIDATLAAQVRPTSDRRDQILPLVPVLADILPGGGLQRGGVVVVEAADGAGAGGATTLAFALLSAATTGGAWCAAVGVGDVGILALAELGVELGRLVLVPAPGRRWPEVAAALIDGFDAVVVCPPSRVRPGVARRLAARARERRSALVVLARHGPWPEGPDVRLTVAGGRWQGVGIGHGHLQGRRVDLVATGRRGATRPTRAALWLPGGGGEIERYRDKR